MTALFPDPRPPIPGGIDLRCADVRDVLADMPEEPALVVADPPWSYRNGQNGRASEHYDLLPMNTIGVHLEAAYAVAAEDAYLLLWCTWPVLAEWWPVATSLSWEYLTGGAWAKTGTIGVGYHWRGDSEPVLVYRKGAPKPHDRDVRNCHVSVRANDPTIGGNAGVTHSEKPLGWARDHVRAFCPPGGLVFDVYAGMAPYARACLAEGRRYIGAEVDPTRHRRALGLLAGRVGL